MMGDKHILFDKDHELSETLDAMVIDVVGSYMIRGKRKSLDNLVGTTSWRESLKKLRTDFLERLAEPDAAETAAAFVKVFEEKRKMISELDLDAYDPEARDAAIFSLSEQAKTLGIYSRRYKKDDSSLSQRLELTH